MLIPSAKRSCVSLSRPPGWSGMTTARTRLSVTVIPAFVSAAFGARGIVDDQVDDAEGVGRGDRRRPDVDLLLRQDLRHRRQPPRLVLREYRKLIGNHSLPLY